MLYRPLYQQKCKLQNEVTSASKFPHSVLQYQAFKREIETYKVNLDGQAMHIALCFTTYLNLSPLDVTDQKFNMKI